MTGAARGIGAAITRRLAGEGWRLVAVDSDAGRLAAVAHADAATPEACSAARGGGGGWMRVSNAGAITYRKQADLF